MSLGKAVPHDSAVGHVTGESVFVDDRPAVKGELQVGFVGSPVAAGRLIEVDPMLALKVPGVVAVFTAKDFKKNIWGTIVHDQPLLVEDRIGYRDEPVCLVVAETREALRAGRLLVKVSVEESAAVLTLEEAIEQKHFLPLAFGITATICAFILGLARF